MESGNNAPESEGQQKDVEMELAGNRKPNIRHLYGHPARENCRSMRRSLQATGGIFRSNFYELIYGVFGLRLHPIRGRMEYCMRLRGRNQVCSASRLRSFFCARGRIGALFDGDV